MGHCKDDLPALRVVLNCPRASDVRKPFFVLFHFPDFRAENYPACSLPLPVNFRVRDIALHRKTLEATLYHFLLAAAFPLKRFFPLPCGQQGNCDSCERVSPPEAEKEVQPYPSQKRVGHVDAQLRLA